MAEVARAAGVSRTAVSFALNNSHSASISPATKQRILTVAEELGYRPHAAAKALARKRSGLYGLVTEIVTAPYAVDIIKGAQDQAWDQGEYLLIAPGEADSEQENAVEKLLEQRVEGFIFAATWHRAVTIPEAARQVPCVLVNCFDAAGELPSIVPDEASGGRQAARTLLQHGHRRIGHITLYPEIPAQQGRLRGFREELATEGQTLPEEYIEIGDGTAESGYRGAKALLDLPTPPTAIFCGNDRTAMGAYDAARDAGLSIPHDVSIVGFDNQEILAPHLRPGLTTVALPFAEMGTEGVKTLKTLTAGSPINDSQIVIDCPLIARSSVGLALR